MKSNTQLYKYRLDIGFNMFKQYSFPFGDFVSYCKHYMRLFAQIKLNEPSNARNIGNYFKIHSTDQTWNICI